MSYYELWTILGNWKSEFSTEDFATAFSSPDARKVLFDMASKGLLERTGRGAYKVMSPDRYLRSKYNVGNAYDSLRTAKAPYALTNVDSVLVWTKGGYNANRFFGSYPVYLRIGTSDVEYWKEYFKTREKKYVVVGSTPRETRYGIYFVLLPEDRFEFEVVNGLKVDSLNTTVEFCRKDPYTYAPALEMLDKEYKLGLGAKYAEPAIVR
jgi:hypothetical protein